MYIADLHIHSRYSRATSRECVPEYLELWARRKGIHLLGTGDFTHPAWRQELEEKLIPAEEGLYCLREGLRLKSPIFRQGGLEGDISPRFVVSGEVSSIYKKNGRVRKVHNLILLPGLSEAGWLSKRLEAIGNIHSDGRPILGLDSRDLLEVTLEVCPRAIFVPAHIWTPHFSMFGAFSGFDTVEECFEDLTPYVHAMETGLSSDPAMNWRLSALDRFQLVSNSDAHSPAKLGREANLLDIPLSYDGLYGAIQEGKGLMGTIEFFPEEGKYFYDGHRKCNLCLSPGETEKYQGKCPVCGKKLTLGVSHRIGQLADRDEGFVRPGAVPFENLVPLPEVIAASTGSSATSKKSQNKYTEMLAKLGTEFSILRERPIEEIQRQCGYPIAEGIRRLRQGKVRRFPGFDGEYGIIRLFEPWEIASMEGQMSLFAWGGLPLGEAAHDGQKGRQEAEGQSGEGIYAGSQKVLTGKGAPARPVTGAGANLQKAPTPPLAENAPAAAALNEEQLGAVRSVSPKIAVAAGPGTGKTKTLVSRILYLLENRKVKPSEITAVTFTNQAAREMKTRLEHQLGKKPIVNKIRIGTFHSISMEQLKAAGEKFILAEESAALELVREVAEELGIGENPKRLRQKISQRKIEAAEGKGYGGWEGQERLKVNQAATRYQERLAAMAAYDFDDLLIKALKMAQEGATSFPYLLVDEFQDINPLQYRLVQAWGRGGRETFFIGDPNQAIYGFRGADYKNFECFCQEGDTNQVFLRKNYRSTPEILAACGAILQNGGKLLEPVKGSGFPVRLVQAEKERDEAIFVAKEINRLVGGMDMLDAQEGFSCPDGRIPRSFADIAVLYRTHRQAGLLETCLKKEGVPYVVAGREGFLEEDVVRGSLGFFRSLLNPEDGLSRKLCRKLLWGQKEDGPFQSQYSILSEKYGNSYKRGTPQKLWASWIKDMGLSEDPSMEKLAAMAVFYRTMEEMLTSLAFGRESDLKRCGGKTYTADAVTLMTIHGSKGLEFPVVLLYGARKGMIPLDFQGREGDPEEERRLLYVAMTRAKEELIMTSSGELSPFIRHIPDKAIQKEAAQRHKGWDGYHQMSLFD